MSTETNIKFHVFNQAHLYYVNGLADIGENPDFCVPSDGPHFSYECVMNSSESLMNYLKRCVAKFVSLN
jgi:hypothetical protein